MIDNRRRDTIGLVAYGVALGAMMVLVMACTVSVIGCGCRKDKVTAGQAETPEEMQNRLRDLDEKRAEQQPEFEFLKSRVLPADDGADLNLVKPGHWFNISQGITAHHHDQPRSDLRGYFGDNSGRLEMHPAFVVTRPVSLTKGQAKQVEMLLLADPKPGVKQFHIQLQTASHDSLLMQSEPTSRMLGYQHLMVVLSERADDFQFLKLMRSVRLQRPISEVGGRGDIDYFVKLPKGTRPVDLPSHSLAWTNIAYVIWDDFDPDVLSPDQQQAMFDWLHWGGQLIVNGPRSLSRLASSAWGPLLPAKTGEPSSLSPEMVEVLNRHWTFADSVPLELDDTAPPLTTPLHLASGSRFVEHTSELLAEKQIGRGRIVVSAFHLPHPVFTRWSSWDTFFNACCLNRPGRQFRSLGMENEFVESWDLPDPNRDDPRLTSQLRYLTRDAAAVSAGAYPPIPSAAPTATPPATSNNVDPAIPYVDESTTSARIASGDTFRRVAVSREVAWNMAAGSRGRLGFHADANRGVAAWNDRSHMAIAAREALEVAAGISVPSIKFLLTAIGTYLLFLGPVNWTIFKLLNRVEWAWAAVPPLAILGALAVVKFAQLDIGFARSHTEIAVVELQPGYDRAHVTRYLGLYTSLTSQYEIESEEPSMLIQPFGESSRRVAAEMAIRGAGVRFTGLRVFSNSTGMVHSEQMLPIGGSIGMRGIGSEAVLVNSSSLDLRGAAIVRRDVDDELEVAWLGDVAVGATNEVSFTPLESDELNLAAWEQVTETRQSRVEGELNIRHLINVAADPARLEPGEMILVGWSDQRIPGIQITPAANQVKTVSVVFATLQHAEPCSPRRDTNTIPATPSLLPTDDEAP